MSYQPNLSRRAFIKVLTASLLLSSCGTELPPPSEPTATPPPLPTATAIANADEVAHAYLAAWQQGDYAAMYQLLTPDSRVLVRDVPRLAAIYQTPLSAATVQQVETQLQSLLYQGEQAVVGFGQTWQTTVFGPIQATNQMRLKYGEGVWGVVWQPTLVLPQLGEGLSLAFLGASPTRGNIYDASGHALASVGEIITVGVVPQQLENVEATVRHLSTITGGDAALMEDKIFEAQPDWFVPLATINFDISLQYDELFNSIPGVQRRVHQGRMYNDGDTAAHVIGYMGAIPEAERIDYRMQGYAGDELVGLMAVEAWGEPHLAGKRGGRLVTLSPSQQVVSEIATTTSHAGSHINLTFDTQFQATVERLLGERPGAVVVMEPQKGVIYALANFARFKPAVITPGFDVAEWLASYTDESRPLINRATQGLYPPASIFKIVTMAAALEALGMSPQEQFSCPGYWDGLGSDFIKKCWIETGHGAINLFDGLTESCDVVFYNVGLALHQQDPNLLPLWAHHFGLGRPTTLQELPESSGVVPDNTWTQATLGQPYFDGDAVNSAIGQGYMLSTPLQITRMMAAIANGGLLVSPYVATEVVTVDGQVEPFPHAPTEAIPISSNSLNLIQQSLAQVVSGAQGTARQAFVGFAQTVAGKTGTAESGQEEPHAWFSGYSPIEKPEVVITVLLEYAGEGSAQAAPLFREVAEAFFNWRASRTEE